MGVDQSKDGISRDGAQDALLRALLDAAPEAIVVIDDHGRIESFSSAAIRLFGYAADEVIGRDVAILMPAPYHDQHDGHLARYRETGEQRIIGVGRTVVGQKRDGTIFPIELKVGETALGPRRVFMGFIRDVTEHQKAERRWQEVHAELLHVSRLSEMGQMASALAHELNQPLTAAANYAKAAHRTMDPLDAPQATRARELIDKAIAQILRGGQIIRRLRGFVEKAEANRAPELLTAVIDEALALSLVGAAEADVTVITDFDPTLAPVWIDKVQIQQVILNLIRNAVEAMQTVKKRELTVSARLVDGCGHVAVSDTGPGLPEAVAAQLFQPFVTTKENGMGIGLSICRSIIDAHGGQLWTAPNEGPGVTFAFSLPLAPASSAAH